MKTNQKVTYLLNGEKRSFLLMPSEVNELLDYLKIFPEKKLIDAFSWFSGKESSQIKEVKIELTYLD